MMKRTVHTFVAVEIDAAVRGRAAELIRAGRRRGGGEMGRSAEPPPDAEIPR